MAVLHHTQQVNLRTAQASCFVRRGIVQGQLEGGCCVRSLPVLFLGPRLDHSGPKFLQVIWMGVMFAPLVKGNTNGLVELLLYRMQQVRGMHHPTPRLSFAVALTCLAALCCSHDSCSCAWAPGCGLWCCVCVCVLCVDGPPYYL
jgi:hypothetical protein